MSKYYFFILFIFLIGCKSRPVQNIAIPKGISKDSILMKHSLKRINANTIHFKRTAFTIESNDLSQSLNGSYFINKDSFIIFSVQALLGIEVARIKISPTEVVILDRFKKQALFINYHTFVSKYVKGVTYNTLQSILLNSLFDLSLESEGNISSDRYVSDYTDSLYILKKQSIGFFSWLTPSKSQEFDQSFYFDTSSGNLIQINIVDNSLHSTLRVVYSSFFVDGGLILPLGYDVSATINDKSYKLSILSNIFIKNGSSGINFSIPSSYEKIYK